VPLRQVARLSRQHRLLITHGNGPQVGNLLLQQEAEAAVPRLPLELLVAQTQGQIGYMIEATLESELLALGVQPLPLLVSLISYVTVNAHDTAFQQPSKPIGPVFTAAQAGCLSDAADGQRYRRRRLPQTRDHRRSAKSVASLPWTLSSSAAAVVASPSYKRGARLLASMR
jgi:carbamate kinase